MHAFLCIWKYYDRFSCKHPVVIVNLPLVYTSLHISVYLDIIMERWLTQQCMLFHINLKTWNLTINKILERKTKVHGCNQCHSRFPQVIFRKSSGVTFLIYIAHRWRWKGGGSKRTRALGQIGVYPQFFSPFEPEY